MTRLLVLAILVAASVSVPSECSSHPATSSSQEAAHFHVVVRAYSNELMPVEEWYAALAMASRILADAAVDVEWLQCGRAEPASSPCNAPVATDELALRMIDVHTPRQFLGKLPVGYSLVDTGLHRGTLATIYYDRVLWLAAAGHADPLTLAARAIAHEIGHLLRGGNEHSTSGLMRAVWDRDELRRDNQQDWQFTAADARAMRAGFMARPRTTTVEGAVAWGTR